MKRVSVLRYKNVYIDYWNFAINKISYFVFYCVNNKDTGQNARMQPFFFRRNLENLLYPAFDGNVFVSIFTKIKIISQ